MVRALILFTVMVLVGLFALLNWPALSALTPLSLGYTTVLAPLGVIMLGLTVFMSVLFTMWALSLQASALRESRRQTQELQAQRELANKAEASRFVELRNFLTTDLMRVSQAAYDVRTDLLARMDRLQEESRRNMEQTANGLAAHIGELEDRLERGHVIPASIDVDDDDRPLMRRR